MAQADGISDQAERALNDVLGAKPLAYRNIPVAETSVALGVRVASKGSKRMKIRVLTAVAAIGVATSANAATVTLESTSGDGFGNTVFTYQGTLTEDEGVRSGDKLIIYDIGG